MSHQKSEKKARSRHKPEKIVSNLVNFLTAYYFKQLTINELQIALTKPVIQKEINNPCGLPDLKKTLVTITALEWSIMRKDWKLTRILLNAGANPDGGYQEHPIFLAIDNLQHAKTDSQLMSAQLTLNLLKQNNVRLDVKAKSFKNPIDNSTYGIAHFILSGNNVCETLKKMLTIFPQGIDLNAFERDATPLMRSLYLKNFPVVKLLCENDVSLKPTILDGMKLTPLKIAIYVGEKEAIQFILNYMVEKRCDDIQSILENALEEYLPVMDIEVLRLILETNLIDLNKSFLATPEPGSSKPHNLTLMHKACERADIAIFELLLQKGGMVNIHQVIQNTPSLLLVAILQNKLDFVEWLLDSDLLDEIAIFSGWYASKIVKKREAFQEAIETRYYELLAPKAHVDLLMTGMSDIDAFVLPRLDYLITRDIPQEIAECFHMNAISIAYKSFHLAIKKGSINCVKYFMDFCNPFFEYHENSAVLLAIYERNYKIMEIFVQDCRQKGKMQALDACLSLNESFIKTLPDAEKYLSFLQTIHRSYFQERTPISFHFFESASAHQFLKEQGIKDLPVKSQLSDKKETLFKPKINCHEPTWFGGQRIDMQLLKPIEGNHSHNAFIWLLEEEAYAASGCTALQFEKFQSTRPSFASGSTNIEKITLPYELPCNINGHALTLQCSYELRIKNSVARILLFPVYSDCKRSVIYIGGKYLKDGLHKSCDSANLMNSNRHGTRMVHIAIPVISAEKSLGDECSKR